MMAQVYYRALMILWPSVVPGLIRFEGIVVIWKSVVYWFDKNECEEQSNNKELHSHAKEGEELE